MSIINSDPTQGTVSSGAQLSFAVGTQANLEALTSATDGRIYLTSDTHKLYVGNSDNTITELNQIIILNGQTSVTATEKLVGRFAYNPSSNALYGCVSDGTTVGWKQINETSTVTPTNAITLTNNTSKGTTTIKSTVGVSETGSVSSASYTLAGSGGITVSASGSTITIDGSSAGNQELSTSDATSGVNIDLSKEDGSTSSVNLVPGKNITLSQADGAITVAATDKYLSSWSLGTASEGFTLQGARNDGTTLTKTTVDPTIVVGEDSTSTVHFVNGTATLPVYTKTEIDKKITDLNAVVYRGTITQDSSGNGVLPVSNVQNGDLFLVATDGTVFNGTTYNKGDMLIATGTEGTDGYIASANITWNVIESTEDTDTTYNFNKNNNGFVIVNNNTGSTVGGINITSGDTNSTGGIKISSSVNSSTKVVTATVSHKAVSVTKNTGAKSLNTSSKSSSIAYITGVTTDGLGHLTSTTTETLNITGNDLSSVSVTATSGSTYGTSSSKVTTGVGMTSGTAGTGTFTLASNNNNLTITTDSSNKVITLDLVWDSF